MEANITARSGATLQRTVGDMINRLSPLLLVLRQPSHFVDPKTSPVSDVLSIGQLPNNYPVLFLCLSSETSLNIFFSHRTSTPSAFEVITETRYINYLLTYSVSCVHRL